MPERTQFVLVRHGHVEDDGHPRILSFEVCLRHASPLDSFTHLFRRGGLALDRLPRSGECDCIAERSAPRQAQISPDIIGKFSLDDPVVAIGDRLLLRPATGITPLRRLPLPFQQIGEAS